MVLQGIDLDRCWDIAEAHRILRGGRDGDPALAWATVLEVVYLVLACWFFASVYRYAVRTGLIARYSAETVS